MDLAAQLPHSFVSSSAVALRGSDGAFEVELCDGRVLAAKAVVLALGVPGPPQVPQAFQGLPHLVFQSFPFIFHSQMSHL